MHMRTSWLCPFKKKSMVMWCLHSTPLSTINELKLTQLAYAVPVCVFEGVRQMHVDGCIEESLQAS